MKNKRFLIFTLIAIFFSSSIFSQKNDLKLNHKKIEDGINFEKAKNSIYNGNWVFEATEIAYEGKPFSLIQGNKHFILNEGDSCYVQLYPGLFAGPGGASGSNGYKNGKCKSENISIKKEKEGEICQKMVLHGINLKAEVYITLPGQGNYAIADIYNINAKKSYKVHYMGRIFPLSESEYKNFSDK